MSETKIQNGGGSFPRVQAEGTETAEQILKLENKMVCPDFGGSVEFGSYDPYEGEYYWCEACGNSPILGGEN
jgi:hypothetical protein